MALGVGQLMSLAGIVSLICVWLSHRYFWARLATRGSKIDAPITHEIPVRLVSIFEGFASLNNL